jgi:hypothetical protein
MFSAGGAGAQSEIGLEIARQLAPRIREGKMKLVLSAGTNKKLKKLFQNAARGLRLEKNPNLEILFEEKIGNYFNRFNKTLRKVDILWTKPSELSFIRPWGCRSSSRRPSVRKRILTRAGCCVPVLASSREI